MEITPGLSTPTILWIGFVFGLRHAVEADHLAAVTAIVSEKQNIWTASIVGGLWGLGHAISLFVVGALVIFMKVQISESTQAKLEAVVGGMLILLGANAIRKIFTSEKIHVHVHDHDGRRHAHFHAHESEEQSHAAAHHHRSSPRSVLIGMVHGLAGSAALMLLIESSSLAMLYILIFSAGSIGGMMAMSFLIGLPFHFTAARLMSLNNGIRFCAGAFSVCLGLFIVYEKLVVGA
ncbi:MAG: urease accessory protein UreH [Blastocatellia bacterium]|nr:urease accessory protein UreH [Blastocatellia bacterium]